MYEYRLSDRQTDKEEDWKVPCQAPNNGSKRMQEKAAGFFTHFCFVIKSM